MMKFYADLFALTADSISAKSIRRLRWLTIGSLPYLPLIAYLILFGLPHGYAAIPFMVSFLLCSVLTITVLLARIVNRVWSPDKYLDEWEKDLKRRSMSMGFMVVIYATMGLGMLWGVSNDLLISLAGENVTSIPLVFVILIVGIGFYTQIFTQLLLIVPMDEDDLEEPQYVVTSARSILGIVALLVIVPLSLVFVAGYYSGHRDHVIEHDIQHAAAQAICGDVDVDTHKKTEAAIDVICEGSDSIIRLDPETLKPLD